MIVVRDDAEVYRRHADRLVRLATAMVGAAEASDVVSDAVVTVLASPSWRTVDDREAYLYRAVVNAAHSRHRRDHRRVATERRAAVLAVRGAAAGEGDWEVRAALAELSPRQRAVVFLTYWEDRTPADAGRLLGLSDGAVRRHLARARAHLRKRLS